MSTARTHLRNVGRGSGAVPLTGAARPRVTEPKPEDFSPISAETFGAPITDVSVEVVEEPYDPAVLDYDPADHTVDDVKQYVIDNPDAAAAVLELEENGKDRSTLTEWLDAFLNPED